MLSPRFVLKSGTVTKPLIDKACRPPSSAGHTSMLVNDNILRILSAPTWLYRILQLTCMLENCYVIPVPPSLYARIRS